MTIPALLRWHGGLLSPCSLERHSCSSGPARARPPLEMPPECSVARPPTPLVSLQALSHEPTHAILVWAAATSVRQYPDRCCSRMLFAHHQYRFLCLARYRTMNRLPYLACAKGMEIWPALQASMATAARASPSCCHRSGIPPRSARSRAWCCATRTMATLSITWWC